MNPAVVIPILKLVIEEAPVVMKMIQDLRAGKLPTEADWKELETLGEYSSKDASLK
jgi:hypothetical protein